MTIEHALHHGASADEPQLLDNGALDAVTAGMSCSTARAVAHAYITFAKVMLSMGDSVGSALMSGKASGLMDGACT